VTGSSLEDVENLSLDHFNTWVQFFRVNPPVRELINLAQANIAFTVAAVAPRGRGKRGPEFKNFTFDFEKALMTDEEKVDDKIRKMFGK